MRIAVLFLMVFGIAGCSKSDDPLTEDCMCDGQLCPSSHVCREASGDCDVAETCTGAAAACPSDAALVSGSFCWSEASASYYASTCNGTDITCTATSSGTAFSFVKDVNNSYILPDSHPLFFSTVTTYDGNLGGRAGADAKCQAEAAKYNLGGIFKAFLAIANLNNDGYLAPPDLMAQDYYNLSNTKTVGFDQDNVINYWGTLSNTGTSFMFPNGSAVEEDMVFHWVGLDNFLLIYNSPPKTDSEIRTCAQWTSTGDGRVVTQEGAFTTKGCSNTLPLLCFQVQ